MPRVYRTQLEVRGYELHSFGHVNNAVYFNYLEFARWKMLNEAGITIDKIKEWQRWPVIAKAEAEYYKPTFMGDRLEIETETVEHSRTSFTIEQRMFRGGTLV